MKIIMQIPPHKNYYRRSGMDRRRFIYASHIPERRSGKERRGFSDFSKISGQNIQAIRKFKTETSLKNINDFQSCTNHSEILQKALAAREEFLRLHPQQRAYQSEIDRILDKSGDIHGRLASLRMLIEGKLLEMKNELIKLHSLLQDRAQS